MSLKSGRYFGDIVHQHVGRDPDNVGLDLAGGSGRALRTLLLNGILGSGIVTNYLDKRTDNERLADPLVHIDGDLIERPTWEKIFLACEDLAPDGLALIMHRPVGALPRFAPHHYEGAAHVLLDMLRPGGVFMAQIPAYLRTPSRIDDRRDILDGITARFDVSEVVLPRDSTALSSFVVIKSLEE